MLLSKGKAYGELLLFNDLAHSCDVKYCCYVYHRYLQELSIPTLEGDILISCCWNILLKS